MDNFLLFFFSLSQNLQTLLYCLVYPKPDPWPEIWTVLKSSKYGQVKVLNSFYFALNANRNQNLSNHRFFHITKSHPITYSIPSCLLALTYTKIMRVHLIELPHSLTHYSPATSLIKISHSFSLFYFIRVNFFFFFQKEISKEGGVQKTTTICPLCTWAPVRI